MADVEVEPLSALLYMAPEAASGMAANAFSDLYSLGATFYHALAGRPPHEGQTAAQLQLKHVTETPPLLAKLVPHVNRRITRIIDRLIAKSPSARYSSCRALLEELQALGALGAAAPAKDAVVERTAPAATQAEAEATALQRPVLRPPAARKVRWAVGIALRVAMIAGVVALEVWTYQRILKHRGAQARPAPKSDRNLERLIARLKHDDPRARIEAAIALGQLGDKRAVEPLIKALKDEAWRPGLSRQARWMVRPSCGGKVLDKSGARAIECEPGGAILNIPEQQHAQPLSPESVLRSTSCV